jgi:CYTH domain-containing protein
LAPTEPSVDFRQGFLAITNEVEVRVRAAGASYLVAVELDSTDPAEAFEPPAGFGQEATDSDGWNNASRAVNGVQDAE